MQARADDDRVRIQNMHGGEWKSSEQRLEKGNSIDSRQNFRSIFGRASYEFSEAFEVFVQASYNYSNVYTRCCPQFNRVVTPLRGVHY